MQYICTFSAAEGVVWSMRLVERVEEVAPLDRLREATPLPPSKHQSYNYLHLNIKAII